MEVSNFKPSLILDKELLVEGAGSHFYKIGLSLYPHGIYKRSKLREPLVGFLFQTAYLLRAVYILVSPDGDMDFYRKVGGFGFIFGTVKQLELTVIFTILLSYETQILNYFNYRRGVRPTFLRLFDMLSGEIPPQDIGLTSEPIVLNIVRRARLLFFAGTHIPLSLASSLFCINLLAFFLTSSWEQLLFYVLPHSIGWFLIVIVVYNNSVWQLIYFYLIALYLKSKLKEVNNRLESRDKWKQKLYFSRTVTELSQIYGEIGEYNGSYWSYYLLIIWLNCGGILSTLTYLSLFGDMLIYIRFFCCYFDVFYILLLLLIVNMCASVYLEAKKPHNLLIGIMCKTKLNSCKRMKVLCLIERIGKRKIGFSCWKLFIVNSFRGFEIIALCIVLFLHCIEMSR